MGCTDVFLVPSAVPADPEKYACKVKEVLLEMGVISGRLYDPKYADWWQRGNGTPLQNQGRFEWIKIFGKRVLELVPDSPSVYPKCPRCGRLLEEGYYDAVNGYEEVVQRTGERLGYEFVQVRCDACDRGFRLDELESDPPILLLHAFISMSDVSEELDPEWLRRFDAKMGISHRAISYWYT
jgi:hypothetical protein